LRHETNFSMVFDIPTHHAFRILKRRDTFRISRESRIHVRNYEAELGSERPHAQE